MQPPLRALDTWLSVAWTGDGVQVVRDNEDARYVVAEDGGELWIDSFTVAADAPHKAAAYAFLDYITQPKQAAAETEFCLFPHANDKATDAARRRGQGQPGHLPERRFAGEARVRGQRHVQQPASGPRPGRGSRHRPEQPTMTRSTVSDARPRRRVGAALLVVPTALWYVGFLLAPLVVLVGHVGR